MLDYAVLRDQAWRVRASGSPLDKTAIMAKSRFDSGKGNAMQNMSAKEAKYGFGRLIDLARSEPVTVEKHGRPVVVVMAVEEYERLRESAVGAATSSDAAKRRKGMKQA